MLQVPIHVCLRTRIQLRVARRVVIVLCVRFYVCVRLCACMCVRVCASLLVELASLCDPAGGAGGGGGDDDDDAGLAGQCSRVRVRVHARVLLCIIFRGRMYDPVLSYVL